MGDVITDWNQVMNQTFAAEGGQATPPANARTMGMVDAAMYDAVNSITQSGNPYLGSYSPSTPGSSTDMTAAAATAANLVMQSIYDSSFGQGNPFSTSFTNLYNTQMSGISDGAAKQRGVEIGTAAAQAMITARANDGWNAAYSFVAQPVGTVGAWQPGSTSGGWGSGTGKFVASEWGSVTPFTMSSGSEFRPTSMVGYAANNLQGFVNSAAYTAAYNQVQSLGGFNSSTRTDDQTQVAYFWQDGPGTYSPVGHWSQIAQSVSASMGLTIQQNAVLFAQLGLAEADTAIAAWDAKREYDLWRPSQAINQANITGNASLVQEAGWTPLLAEPSFPSFVSGHSSFSMAGATVLANFFGTDNISFTSNTESPFLPSGTTRTFTSFSQAAQEAGMSRIYGGIHYSFDNTGGLALGADVANNVIGNFLQPVPEPGGALLILSAGIAALLSQRKRPFRS